MPLNDEGLYKWHGWLPRKLEVNGDAWRAWCGLKSFLQRGLLQKKFGELTWGEKLVLRAAVRKMVEAQS
jgi:hypothetical protein